MLEKNSCENVNCLIGSPVQNADGTCGCTPNTQGILPKYPSGNAILNPATGQVTMMPNLMDWFRAHPFLSLGGAALAVWLLLKMFSQK